MTGARVDVLMSVYNGAATIEQAIQSIQDQVVRDIRIVVVDDGSTDETSAILARIGLSEPRLLVITKPNSGIVDSVSTGLRHCDAPFIARHDADDLSEPDRFEVQMAYLEAHPDCVAVSGGALYIDSNGDLTGAMAKVGEPELADAEWIPAREPYLKQPFLMVRRDGLLAVGGYRPLRVAEDSDLCWRLQEIGRLHNMPRSFGRYRVHKDSISSGSIRNGRIIALYSQMAALSARRRRAGHPDLEFAQADWEQYVNATNLADLHAIACLQLQPEERRRLRISMAAKLIEVCFYRDFEPDRSDCSFIRMAIRNDVDLLGSTNRLLLLQSIMYTALRLAMKGRLAEAMLLMPWRRRPILIMRLAFRVGMPGWLRNRIKR